MSEYKPIEFLIRGIAPLLLHNGGLADPFNPWAKAMKVISSKKKKTDDDLLEMRRLEWYGSLYIDDSGRPIVPGVNLESMLISAGKEQRLGPSFKAGVICDGDFRVGYTGPKTADELWKSGKFMDVRAVRVQQSRVMRCRPIFRDWSLKFSVHFLPDVLNEQQVRDAVVMAGRRKGLGDYLPRFGRFELAA